MCHEVNGSVSYQHRAEQEFHFPGSDRTIPTFTYGYTPGEQKPAIVIIHDIFGASAFYRDMARRLAEIGFAVLLPELFCREGGLRAHTLEAATERAKKHSLATALHDLLAITDLLNNENRKVGLLGFCMGGRYALLAASRIPCIDACVVYYGSLVTGSGHNPIEEVKRIHAPILGFFGENDRTIPIKHVLDYEEAAQEAGKQVDFTIYPEVGHAFLTFATEGDGVEASKQSWLRSLSFFKTHLGA